MKRATLVVAAATVLLCVAGYRLASSYPDGLETVAQRLGFADRERTILLAPLADYERSRTWTIVASLTGAALCFAAAFVIGRFSERNGARRRPRKEKRVAPGSAGPLE